MLERLKHCMSLDDMVELGVALLNEGAMDSLREDIRKKRLVFNSENYWSSDALSLYSVPELIGQTILEPETSRVLHLLQILQKSCPAISSSISKLLAKATC